MRKRFILFIDLSEHSSNLIKYAYQWSIQAKAQLLLFHQSIVQSPALAETEIKQKILEEANEEALQKLKVLTRDIVPHPESIQYHISESDFQISLPQLLAEDYEDLIFVGLKGTSMLKKIFFGSYALQVINSTNNIVVAMPKEIDAYTHEKIFVAINEKHPINIQELNNFLEFIEDENTHLTFFHLAQTDEDTSIIQAELDKLRYMYEDRFNTTTAIYEGKDRLQDIKKVINDKIDEILVVQRGSRLLSDKLFRRFLINDLVHEGQTPLVVLPN